MDVCCINIRTWEGLGNERTLGLKKKNPLHHSPATPTPTPHHCRRNHSKCLVHCKMGVSRSASTVIAYAMKEFGWPLEKAYNYVKQKRSITRPNAGFMKQLSEYEGILDARWVPICREDLAEPSSRRPAGKPAKAARRPYTQVLPLGLVVAQPKFCLSQGQPV